MSRKTLIEKLIYVKPDNWPDVWELHTLDDNASWVADDSGVYATCNITNSGNIRLDFFRAKDDTPMFSVQSLYARALYKWIAANLPELGQEHNLYLGYEIGKAEQCLKVMSTGDNSYEQS